MAMPKTENKTEKAAEVAAPEATQETTIETPPVNPEVEQLKLELAAAQGALQDAELRIQQATDAEAMALKEVKKLQKQLADAARAVQGKGQAPDNVACHEGKQLKIIRTVIAKFALDDVKKGYLNEDDVLIVVERS